MDIDGYPEEHELKKIEEWDYKDFVGLIEYVEERWAYADFGYFKKGRKYLYLSTAGWSGNESIIRALMSNYIFWDCCWVSSRRGGHYVFEIKKHKEQARDGKEKD